MSIQDIAAKLKSRVESSGFDRSVKDQVVGTTSDETPFASFEYRSDGWRGVVDPDDQPVEFSAERLQALLQINWFFVAARQALFEVSREGVVKNSSPGPAGAQTQVQA